jgi:competence ComEA-like helix-hairpin-helix protein
MRALFMLLTIVAVITTGALPAAAQPQSSMKAARPAAAKSAKPAATPTAPVNLNTATQAQLESLPGVGPKAAQRILEYRQKNGGFKKIEDILESSRSCPSLLSISCLSAHRSVARHR